jgi:hypothetical protein
VHLDWLIGKTCTRVSCPAAATFVFEFGEYCVAVECSWRIVDRGRLAIAHRDHGQDPSSGATIDASAGASELLLGKRVVAAYADDAIGDIRVAFEGPRMLEVFNDASRAEAWTLSGPNKYVWVAGTGGEISGHPG